MLRSMPYDRQKNMRPLVFFPMDKRYWYQQKFKQCIRRKWVFTSHGFYDATYEIKMFDPIRMGYYATYIGD